jgi:hypothetical protein
MMILISYHNLVAILYQIKVNVYARGCIVIESGDRVATAEEDLHRQQRRYV